MLIRFNFSITNVGQFASPNEFNAALEGEEEGGEMPEEAEGEGGLLIDLQVAKKYLVVCERLF